MSVATSVPSASDRRKLDNFPGVCVVQAAALEEQLSAQEVADLLFGGDMELLRVHVNVSLLSLCACAGCIAAHVPSQPQADLGTQLQNFFRNAVVVDDNLFSGFVQSMSNRDTARKKQYLLMPASWKAPTAAARGSSSAGKATAQKKGTSKQARVRRARSKSPGMVGGSGGGAGHKKQRQDASASSGVFGASEQQPSPTFEQGDDQDHVGMDDQVVVQDRPAFTPRLMRPDATRTGKFLAQCTLLAACMIFAAHVQVQW